MKISNAVHINKNNAPGITLSFVTFSLLFIKPIKKL